MSARQNCENSLNLKEKKETKLLATVNIALYFAIFILFADI